MSILYSLENYTKIIEKPLGIITSGTVDCGNGVYLLKAGTPISNAGAVANSSSAKYLVAEDFYFYSNTPSQPKLVKLIETGYVDLAKAEAAAGVTYADAAKSALATAGIILVDGALQTGGGSSLPDASAASAGDVLMLDENKDPEWATPSGAGGDTFVVTFTGNAASITSDKTAAEIVAAAQAKKAIVGYWGNSPYQLELVDAYEYGGELNIVGIQFLSIWFGDDGPEGTPINYARIMFDGSSWAYEEKTQHIFFD